MSDTKEDNQPQKNKKKIYIYIATKLLVEHQFKKITIIIKITTNNNNLTELWFRFFTPIYINFHFDLLGIFIVAMRRLNIYIILINQFVSQ